MARTKESFDPQLPIIQADPAQLQQVFINLINNSADAIEGSGTVTVSTHAVSKEFGGSSCRRYRFGHCAGEFGPLFTPFFTTKAVGKGTGLGLAIVYGIVKSIAVRSEWKASLDMAPQLPLPAYSFAGWTDRSISE